MGFSNPSNVLKEAKNTKWLQKLDETVTPNLFYNQCQKDKHSLCGKWADEGECEDKRTRAGAYLEKTNHLWMHVNCMSSCCPGCPKSCPASKAQCTNVYSDSRCVNWSRAGGCTRNPTWMKQNCANECCETCQPVPVPLPAPLLPSTTTPLVTLQWLQLGCSLQHLRLSVHFSSLPPSLRCTSAVRAYFALIKIYVKLK